MRDAAAAAAMSDPEINRWFRRRWSDEQAQLALTPSKAQAPDSTVKIQNLDHDLTLLGHDLLMQWRRERTGKKMVR